MSTQLTDTPPVATPPPSPGPDEVIVCHALTKVYPGPVKAVDRLDLSVRKGEIFGLLGPNGAGKTTTVGMLTTRVIPTAGRAIVGGIDVVAHPAAAKQAIGVVPQTSTLDRSLSVWENLYFHGRYFGMGAKQARAAADRELERFRLASWAKSDVLALSGGMAQRLMVARAILHHPSILFLDEPTAGLDPQSRIALWEILTQLHDEGQTILLTTHYMEEADQLCDRLAIMDHGKLLALDAPANLKRSVGAATVVTVTTDDDASRLADHVRGQPHVADVVVSDGAVRVFMDDATRALLTVVNLAENGGFRITDLSLTEPTLETVFINLTGKDLRE